LIAENHESVSRSWIVFHHGLYFCGGIFRRRFGHKIYITHPVTSHWKWSNLLVIHHNN